MTAPAAPRTGGREAEGTFSAGTKVQQGRSRGEGQGGRGGSPTDELVARHQHGNLEVSSGNGLTAHRALDARKVSAMLTVRRAQAKAGCP